MNSPREVWIDVGDEGMDSSCAMRNSRLGAGFRYLDCCVTLSQTLKQQSHLLEAVITYQYRCQ